MTDRGDPARPRKRLIIFASLLGALACAVIVQLVRLTVVMPSREGGDSLSLPAVQRGSILDRQGRILAVTTRVRHVSAWTPALSDAAETARLLAPILGMKDQALVDLLASRSGYVLLKRRISDEEAAAITALQADKKLTGVKIEDDVGRLYPQGRLAAHVVGWVGSDNVPLGGVEYSFSTMLAPQPIGTDSTTVYGDQVFLTIDLDVQAIVDRAARAAMAENKPDSLMVLVMDAPTGEILASTSLPDFDPNELTRGTSVYDAATLAGLTSNRTVTFAYEPGSVFKIFSLSGLLNLGSIKPTDVFDDSQPYVKTFSSGQGVTIRDVGYHGMITPQQVIQFSSNVGAAHASDQADAASFYRIVQSFGFGKATGIALSGETPGLLKDVDLWSGRTKPTMVFGQEISVSAMQMVAAATVLANGGLLLRPHIVKKIVSPQGAVVKEFTREPVADVISPDAARSMLAWMETAVNTPNGTARRAAVEGVRISAKTGTAQVVDPSTHRYSEQDFIASLMGIFPTENPRYIVYVVMENPRGQSYYGSVVAAPVFHDIAQAIIDKVGIPRAGTVTGTLPSLAAPGAAPAVTVGSPMPNLAGTPKKLLLPLLLRRDIDVTITGSGFVVSQDPAPGTVLAAGAKVTLVLK